MSIRKTKYGTYQVQWRDKSRKQRSKSFKLKAHAIQFESRLRTDSLPEYLTSNVDLSNGLVFKDFATKWISDYAQVHKTATSVIRDKQTIRDYLNPAIGEIPLREITRREIIQIQSGLVQENRLSPKSINNALSLAHKILNDAVEWGYLATNPATGIKMIKVPEQKFNFWTIAERNKFLGYAKSRSENIHDVVLFTLHTGLRRGEVDGLYRDCIDFERREIVVMRNYNHRTKTLNPYTKGKNIRRIWMNDEVFEVMRKKASLAADQNVFDLDFQHFVDRQFKPMQVEAGVNVITFHDLRHSFASHLAMSGLSMFEIQKLLGHSDLKTTQRYMHLAPDHLWGKTDVLVSKSQIEPETKTKSEVKVVEEETHI